MSEIDSDVLMDPKLESAISIVAEALRLQTIYARRAKETCKLALATTTHATGKLPKEDNENWADMQWYGMIATDYEKARAVLLDLQARNRDPQFAEKLASKQKP